VNTSQEVKPFNIRVEYVEPGIIRYRYAHRNSAGACCPSNPTQSGWRSISASLKNPTPWPLWWLTLLVEFAAWNSMDS